MAGRADGHFGSDDTAAKRLVRRIGDHAGDLVADLHTEIGTGKGSVQRWDLVEKVKRKVVALGAVRLGFAGVVARHAAVARDNLQ